MENNGASPIEAIALGAVQGLTEFLPVSSSGHLIVASWLMEGKPLPLELNIALHIGTLLALLLYFWRDWYLMGMGLIAQISGRQHPGREQAKLIPLLIIGNIPAAVIGFLFEKRVEAWFHHPSSVAIPLALVGIAIWLVDRKNASDRTISDITIKDAIIIGCVQTVALIPGVSRSGSTIMAGRLLRVSRADAARFSFLLGTPITGGAVLLKSGAIITHANDPAFQIGIACSFITGCLAIGFLLRFLRRFGFGAFAIYRVMLAGLIVYLTNFASA